MSGAGVAVVTDSTACLPDGLASAHGVHVVPLQIVIGGRALDEGREATPAQVAEALRAKVPVSTSRPAPAAFAAAYRELAERGHTGVASVHLSGLMSGTVESARLAAQDSPVPVTVVDSESLGMGLGFAVLSAAGAAATGAGVDEVAAAAQGRARRTTTVFYVDTLEYLRRGGRIGAAAALLGSALAVKPLLHLVGGQIQPLEKVRTAAKAIARLEEVAVVAAGSGPVDIAVHHLDAAGRAQALADRLRYRLPALGELHVEEVGAVVGAHVGPGLLGVVVAPR